MKRVFFLACISLLSCKKDDVSQKVGLVKSTVRFKASYINTQFTNDCDSIFLEVKGLQSYSFATSDDPCKNVSYGFRTYHEDTITYIPYIIRTDRDTLENGYLTFTSSGFNYIKY